MMPLKQVETRLALWRSAGAVGLFVLFSLVPRTSWSQSTSGVAGEHESKVAEDPTYDARAFLSHDSAAHGESVVLQITFDNRSEQPVRDLRIERLDAPGLELLGQESTPGPGIDLAMGDRAVFRATLRVADRRLGSRTLGATLAWREGDREEVKRTAVVAESLAVVSRWSADRAPGRTLLFDVLLKGLSLPLALAFIGWFLNRLLHRRAEHVESLRRKHDEELEELRRRRSERLEKLKQLMSRVWTIAENHYLPIGSAVMRLEKDFERYSVIERGFERRSTTGRSGEAFDSGEAAERDRAVGSVFVSMMVLLSRDDALTREVGGWILHDREGEVLVGTLWDDFQCLWTERLGMLEVGRLLLDLGDRPHHAELMECFESPCRQDRNGSRSQEEAARWRALRDQFESWLADEPSFKAARLLLEAMRIVLNLEANRLYAPLYGLEDDFSTIESKLGLADLAEAHRRLVSCAATSETSDQGELAKRLGERANDIASYLEPSEVVKKTREAECLKAEGDRAGDEKADLRK